MTIANSRANENAPNPDSQLLIAGRYRLLEQIGSGRLGDIFAAEDVGRRELGIDEQAAVQLLSGSFSDIGILVKKLERRYAALRSAAHPGIVSYLNTGVDGQSGYVVMELPDGISMREVLRESQDLPLDEVVPVIRAVGEALQYLHSQSIVHGKVSPENVFVTGALDVRLLDVIPLSSSDAILHGVVAPQNQAVARDDVFGLACLAYEMLTGRHPFNYRSLHDVLKAGLEPEPISTIPEWQWNALRRALVANTANSIHSIADFLREFGVSGAERLRKTSPTEPATREPATREPTVSGPVFNPSGTRESAIPKPMFGDSLPESSTMMIGEDDLGDDFGSRPGRVRSFLLFMVLVALGAWYYYGEPQAQFVAAMESLWPAPASPAPGVRVAAPPARSDASPEQPAETVVAAEPQIAETLTEVPIEPEPSDTAAESEPSDTAAESEPTDVLADVPTESSPTEAPVESDFAFEASAITVSERDGAARVAIRQPVSPVEPVSWWVTGHTAVAGADYVPLQGELSATETGAEDTILLVPLVNDATPEPPETFLVNIGRRAAPDGQLELIDSVRVDIIDDD